MDETEKRWRARASAELVGRTIVNVGYLSKEEAKEMGWYARPLWLKLDNGTYIFPMSDDEGNNGGAFGTNVKQLETIPVLYDVPEA